MKYETRVWKPFDRDSYRWAWKDKKFIGVVKEFGRDLHRCHQRIWRGYCDHDIFSIFDWFLGIMPTMLEDFRDHLHGFPSSPDSVSQQVVLDDEDMGSEGMTAWKAVLERMIFLMREADEDTCTRENPYEAEHKKASDEFTEKYGLFGEKLLTDEERKESENGAGTRLYMLSDAEEYKPISDLYHEEWLKIIEYRRACKDEALALFSKWFYDLWD